MPTVTGQDYAIQAYSYHNSNIPYSQLDCVHFVNQVRIDLGLRSMLNGTNTLWRSNNLTWKGTLQQALQRWTTTNDWRDLPQGILLFRIKAETDPTYNEPPIPARYYMDGVGNVTHVGVMTDLGLGIMQSGGYGGRGVHESGWRANYWTHCALQMDVEYPEPINPDDPPNPQDPDDPDPQDPDDPNPPSPPEPGIMPPLALYLINNKRKVLKRRWIKE